MLGLQGFKANKPDDLDLLLDRRGDLRDVLFHRHSIIFDIWLP